MFLVQLKAQFKYLLVFIDAFSKYAIVKPLRYIKAKNMVRALEEALKEAPFETKAIFTDRGTEFRNKEMTDFLKEKGIRQIFPNAYSPNKTSIAERFIRTLRLTSGKILESGQEKRPWAAIKRAVKIYNSQIHPVLYGVI